MNSPSQMVPPWEDDCNRSEEITLNTVSAGDENISPESAPLIDEIASEFIGFWNRLVSQTNWEKGKVIHTWRTRLLDAGLPRSVYSDESIARRIGNVSSQHVGRLRRVFERFGNGPAFRDAERFAGLYWSHYQAALDWDDAEEWLEKAASETLSVALMRIARWEKYGAPPERKPKESEIVDAEPDEDVNPMNDSDADIIDVGSFGDSDGESKKNNQKKKSKEDEDESFDYSDDPEIQSELNRLRGDDEIWKPSERTTGEILKAMTDLPELPADLAGPIEALKTALLDHKLADWSEAAREDVLKWLGALRAVVLAQDE